MQKPRKPRARRQKSHKNDVLADTQKWRWARGIRIWWVMDREDPPSGRSRPETNPDKLKERKSPDDLLFAGLARVALVGPDGFARLRKGVSIELDHEWGWYWQPTEKVIQRDVYKRARAQLASLARSSSTMRNTLSDLNDIAKKMMMMASRDIANRTAKQIRLRSDPQNRRPRPPRTDTIQEDFVPHEKAILLLTEVFSEAVRLTKPNPRRRKRGRPIRHLIGYGFLPQFVLRLLWDVRSAGGELSLDKNQGTGTLVQALKILRPYLPPDFVPKKLPLSTFAAIKVLDRKIADRAAEIDNRAS
jgi:hypothetical protein